MSDTLITLKSFVQPQTVYTTQSALNGAIEVIEQFGNRELVIGGLQQSGDLVAQLWDSAVKKLPKKHTYSKVLILGLGAGSVVSVINKRLPDAHIVGVEIDPEVLSVAKSYFGLDKHNNLTIKQTDAVSYIAKNNKQHDLILVDMYQGEQIPQDVYTHDFLKKIKKATNRGGYSLFNHLRGTRYDTKRNMFEKILQKEFDTVESVHPLVNTVYVCSMVS